MGSRRAGQCAAIVVIACGCAMTVGAAESGFPPPVRNLFRECLARTEAEIDARIAAAWNQFTAGDATTQRLYYPAGDDAAYILDTGNNDVRSEGMSYGMMIAVQLNHRAEFDRLWTWTRRHMYHAEGPRRGFFAWQCTRDGRKLDPGSASDGEEWIAMALFFASHRWQDGAAAGPVPSPGMNDERAVRARGPHPADAIDYGAEAQAVLDAMLRPRTGAGVDVTPMFDRAQRQIVFAPTAEGSAFTDPSYHVPAFYELWARWASSEREFWASAASRSREFWRATAHPQTGLMPEYAHFDGRPYAVGWRGAGRGDFRFDAWRTLANVALDHAWFGRDSWQVEQSNRVLRFLGRWGEICPNQFTLDGAPLSTDTSVGLIAMAAVAGLAAERSLAQPFIERLWSAPIPTGQWRYYDGLLYLLGLLQVSGRFQILAPHAN